MSISDKKLNLTIVGTGPGDPNLLTISAINAIKSANLVAYPVSVVDGKSLAYQIASRWISKSQMKLPLYFPMVKEVEPRKEAWYKARDQLFTVIKRYKEIVFLTLGDPSLFSTGSYILLAIRNYYPQINVKVVPGIASFSTAAAQGLCPLSFQDEQILILSTPDDKASLMFLIDEARSKKRVLVLLKIGKRWKWVKQVLEEMNIIKLSLFAQNIGFYDQKIINASELKDKEISYFSLLIIRQSWPEILP